MDDRIRLLVREYWLYLLIGIAALIIAMLAIRIHIRFWSLDTVGSDTYYSGVEGRRIRDGRNPYERILHGNMVENNKYATYFPLFYEASALVQNLGFRQYQPWIDFWRHVFLFWNFEGFMKSIAFSATRIGLNHFAAASIDSVLNLTGLVARIPFLLMLLGAYFVSWEKAVGRYMAAMLVMGIFIAFNSVLFQHYPTWLMPLLPLAAMDWIGPKTEMAKEVEG